MNSQVLTNEQVNEVLNKINAEAKTFGAVIRNFVAVAKANETAMYMLETILRHKFVQRNKETSTNGIRLAIVAAFPYVNDGVLLHKVNGLFVPYEQYSADIIKKAYYNAVGATKVQKDFTPATEEQIAEAEAKAEAKKLEKAEKKAAEKANAEALAEFVQQILAAESPEVAWTFIQTYKKQAEGNQTSAQ